jgi:hypothetical protein
MKINYLTPEKIEAIQKASTITELTEIALEVVSRMPKKSIGICGPLSHTKSPNFEEYKQGLISFGNITGRLVNAGYPVFDERPYLNKMFELKKEYFIQNPGATQYTPLIKDFYEPILETGKITKMILLTKWDEGFVYYWKATYGHGIKNISLPAGWEEGFSLSDIHDLGEPLSSSEGNSEQSVTSGA